MGHDIDILLHHSSDDYETDFLQVLVAKLRQKVYSQSAMIKLRVEMDAYLRNKTTTLHSHQRSHLLAHDTSLWAFL